MAIPTTTNSSTSNSNSNEKNLDNESLTKAWREAAFHAVQHNEARLLLSQHCQRLRVDLTESERLRAVETQRLAQTLEKMNMELSLERTRVSCLEREFCTAFEQELQKCRAANNNNSSIEPNVNLPNGLSINNSSNQLQNLEREKQALSQKNAALERELNQLKRDAKNGKLGKSGQNYGNNNQIMNNNDNNGNFQGFGINLQLSFCALFGGNGADFATARANFLSLFTSFDGLVSLSILIIIFFMLLSIVFYLLGAVYYGSGYIMGRPSHIVPTMQQTNFFGSDYRYFSLYAPGFGLLSDRGLYPEYEYVKLGSS